MVRYQELKSFQIPIYFDMIDVFNIYIYISRYLTARPRLIFLDLAIRGKFPDSPDAHCGGADMIMVDQLTSC